MIELAKHAVAAWNKLIYVSIFGRETLLSEMLCKYFSQR